MYEKIGGWAVIDKLVDDFYHIMATDPAAHECHLTHAGKDPKESADKLKAFLSGWLGGPKLYAEKYGHPRLRMRHFPFSIGAKESEQWLYCMKKAFELSVIPKELQDSMLEAFREVTTIIRNRD